MNLKLIKKYEKEFLHMLHGGDLLYKLETTKWYQNPQLPFSDDEYAKKVTAVIIDDQYVEFRKAVADGKQLQSRDSKSYLCSPTKYGEWSDTNHTSFCLPVDCYRIKPEEPQFKVGDYVRYIHANSPKSLRISNINCRRYYFENAKIILRIDEIEKWEPKEGEWCWFWDEHYTTAILAKFLEKTNEGYFEHHSNSFEYCEPFIGTLPTHLKDNK
jgi:hypothetical protein